MIPEYNQLETMDKTKESKSKTYMGVGAAE